jgi:polyisoprenoid-binding protein YceI
MFVAVAWDDTITTNVRTDLMTRSLMIPVMALLLAGAAGCGKVGDAPQAKTGAASVDVQTPVSGTTLPIDTAASKVGWVGAKVTGSHEGGFRKFDGTVTVDGSNVTAAKLTIDAASIYTDSEKLEGHLRSPDFFAVEQYPNATFETTEIVPAAGAAGATHMVTGNLMIRGKTNSVTFPASIKVDGGRATAKADFKINRQDWGITYPGAPDDLISDDVRIIFDIVAQGAPSA